jgi:hypothetical protein
MCDSEVSTYAGQDRISFGANRYVQDKDSSGLFWVPPMSEAHVVLRGARVGPGNCPGHSPCWKQVPNPVAFAFRVPLFSVNFKTL